MFWRTKNQLPDHLKLRGEFLPFEAWTSTGVATTRDFVKNVPTFFPLTMFVIAFSVCPLHITTDTPFSRAHVAARTYTINEIFYAIYNISAADNVCDSLLCVPITYHHRNIILQGPSCYTYLHNYN